MPEYSPRRLGGKQFSPIDLGIASIDITASATNTGNWVDVSGYRDFQLVMHYTVTGTTKTAGASNFNIDIALKNGTSYWNSGNVLQTTTGTTDTKNVSANFGVNRAGIQVYEDNTSKACTQTTTYQFSAPNLIRVTQVQSKKLQGTGAAGTVSAYLIAT